MTSPFSVSRMINFSRTNFTHVGAGLFPLFFRQDMLLHACLVALGGRRLVFK